MSWWVALLCLIIQPSLSFSFNNGADSLLCTLLHLTEHGAIYQFKLDIASKIMGGKALS